MAWMHPDRFFGVTRYREASRRVEAPTDRWYHVQVLGSGARLLWVGRWQRLEPESSRRPYTRRPRPVPSPDEAA